MISLLCGVKMMSPNPSKSINPWNSTKLLEPQSFQPLQSHNAGRHGLVSKERTAYGQEISLVEIVGMR